MTTPLPPNQVDYALELLAQIDALQQQYADLTDRTVDNDTKVRDALTDLEEDGNLPVTADEAFRVALERGLFPDLAPLQWETPTYSEEMAYLEALQPYRDQADTIASALST